MIFYYDVIIKFISNILCYCKVYGESESTFYCCNKNPSGMEMNQNQIALHAKIELKIDHCNYIYQN